MWHSSSLTDRQFNGADGVLHTYRSVPEVLTTYVVVTGTYLCEYVLLDTRMRSTLICRGSARGEG